MMNEFNKIYDFQNLYKAFTVASRGKRNSKEVIDFELNLANNLTLLSNSLKDGTYKVSGYYSFMVHDPKDREINALHFKDRVVQHCVCDQILGPILDKKLIYDNAACRLNKGTHFAIKRLNMFLHDYYYIKHKNNGYFLKCDIRKYFDNIDHNILKNKLIKVCDSKTFSLLCKIIDSYEKTPGKGLPLGNQTSQWFAIYYLDGFDRLIKEQLHIKYYSRYMDDCVLIHEDKDYLKKCLLVMNNFISDNLKLSFNVKTKIFPIKNGVNYLGWHFYLTNSGKIIRKVKQDTKYKYKRKLKYFNKAYRKGLIKLEDIDQVINSYHAHLSFGHTYKLQSKIMHDFVLIKDNN